MTRGEALGLLIAALAIFAIGCSFLLNFKDLPARVRQRSSDFWSGRTALPFTFPQDRFPPWFYRYGIGFWFCVVAIVAVIAAGRSL